MNIVLDVVGKKVLNENDLIVFKNGKWIVISKDEFLGQNDLEHQKILKELEEVKNSIKELAKVVKEK